MRLARLGWLALVVGLVVSAPCKLAVAQAPPGGSSSATADELFRQGNALAKQQEWAAAEEAYRSAWQLRRAWDIAANLGIAESENHQWRDAAKHVAYALKNFPATGKPEQRVRLEQVLAKARGETSAVTIDVNVAGAEVRVDGRAVGTSPVGEIFVDPGSRTVEAALAGYSAKPQGIEAVKGSSQHLALVLEREQSAARSPAPAPTNSAGTAEPPVGPRPEPSSEPRPWIVAGGLGVAAALAGTGVALVVASSSLRSDADRINQEIKNADCGHPPPALQEACDDYASKIRDRNLTGNLGIGAFVAAGVFAGAAVAYWLWPRPRTSPPSAPRISFEPTVSTSDRGAMVMGRW